MKLIQIVPRETMRLYGAIVQKEADIRRSGRGTFFRAQPRVRNRARWRHKKYGGSIDLERSLAEVVTVEIKSPEGEGQIFKAFLDWLDRHFSDRILSISIHYR